MLHKNNEIALAARRYDERREAARDAYLLAIDRAAEQLANEIRHLSRREREIVASLDRAEAPALQVDELERSLRAVTASVAAE